MDKKQKILDIICDDLYVPMKFKELAVLLSVPKQDIEQLKQILDCLVSEGKIILTQKNKYIPVNENEFITGFFSSKDKGFGFVLSDSSDDVFISSENTKGALNGDKVTAAITISKKGDKKREGKIIRIIERANEFVVGTYVDGKNFGFVVPDDKRITSDIYIPKSKNSDAKNKQKVVAKINIWPEKGKKPEGEITEILGNRGDIGLDVLCILKRYGLNDSFPETVTSQIQNIQYEITENDINERTDFRGLTVITIDGADSKDLDDAISISKENDIYNLGVHIADVSHYVKENSPIDKEALARGTSVYFTDRVIPMLPKELSNGICSLNPGCDRLTLSVIMTIDKNGNMTDHYITESIINSKKRMTYDEVTGIIDGNSDLCKKYSDIKNDIMTMLELSKILKLKRQSMGSIDFNFPETKITVDEKGKPINVYKYTPTVSNSIIEEFMLMANKTVAEDYFWLELPFVYRIHEKPSQDKLNTFNEFLKPLNLHIKGEQPHSMEYSKMLEKIKGTEKELLISKVMLRSLMKAKYSPANAGHFGLAFKYYCHFTSPIRRYPDLLIHRIIKENIKYGFDEQRLNYLKGFVVYAAEKSSETEINAMEAERAVEDMKKAEYMKQHIGEVFEGIISSVTNFGFFTELENGIEGLVRVADLVDDYYIFDDKNFTLTGEHTKKTYGIGDKIDIVVTNVNVASAQIDFYPAKEFYYE